MQSSFVIPTEYTEKFAIQANNSSFARQFITTTFIIHLAVAPCLELAHSTNPFHPRLLVSLHRLSNFFALSC